MTNRAYLKFSSFSSSSSSSFAIIMTSTSTTRERVQPPSTIDWDAIIDELSLNCAHGAITRVADRHGVGRSTVSRRWSIYCRAVEENDIYTQCAMRGDCDRRRNNRRALSWQEERRVINALLNAHPSPSRTSTPYTAYYATHHTHYSSIPSHLHCLSFYGLTCHAFSPSH